MRRKLTAAIITLNEERYIGRCLRSLTWVDEIVVIDAGSTDATQAICTDPQAPWARLMRFSTQKWEGFRVQRNRSLQAATHDWVLVVDADEECTPELAKRVQTILDSPEEPPFQAYKVRRVEYLMGQEIHGTCWNPSYQDRLFIKTGVEYINDIHEYPRLRSPMGRIHEPFLHNPEFNPDRFFQKMVKYTGIEAKDRVDQGILTNPFRMFFAMPANFLKNYFYYGGYKGGMSGFVVCLMEGISRAVRHVKMWQYQQELKKLKDRSSS